MLQDPEERIALKAGAIVYGNDVSRSPHLNQTFKTMLSNQKAGFGSGGFKERMSLHIAELEERVQSLEALVAKLFNAQIATVATQEKNSDNASDVSANNDTPPDIALENAKIGIFMQKYSQHLSKWLKPVSDGERGRTFSMKARIRDATLETIALIAMRFSSEKSRPIPDKDGDLKGHISFHADAFDWYFSIVASSDFLCGRIDGSEWKPGFGWLASPANAEKVISRKYNKNESPKTGANAERTDSIALPQVSEETLKQMAEMIKQSGDSRDIEEIVKELAGGAL